MNDPPSVPELVAAVREFLEHDVLDATQGRVRFHARVAANALAIVEREIALGPQAEQDHAHRLRSLGFADDAALAAAIRDGSADDRFDEITDAVHATVRAKLGIANPRYLDNP